MKMAMLFTFYHKLNSNFVFYFKHKIFHMAYSENLANRIRERFSNLENVEEKQMMGGLTFMYNGKMCVGIIKDELMCRIDPVLHDTVVERQGCRSSDDQRIGIRQLPQPERQRSPGCSIVHS